MDMSEAFLLRALERRQRPRGVFGGEGGLGVWPQGINGPNRGRSAAVANVKNGVRRALKPAETRIVVILFYRKGESIRATAKTIKKYCFCFKKLLKKSIFALLGKGEQNLCGRVVDNEDEGAVQLNREKRGKIVEEAEEAAETFSFTAALFPFLAPFFFSFFTYSDHSKKT